MEDRKPRSHRSYGHGGDVWTARERWGSNVIDFSANTNPLGMPEAARAAAARALSACDRYPDPHCRELVEAIARHHDIASEAVLCGNGAADLIWRLVATVRPRAMLLTAPTFSEYGAAARFYGARVCSHALDASCGFVLDEGFLAAIDDGIDLVFLCNPNNPTGRTVPVELMGRIVERCRAAGALLAVDECFLGFVSDGAERTLVQQAAAGEGVVVLRAFTKLYGMAGLRLGHLVCGDADLAERVYAAGPPWSVSTPAQAAGVAALADAAFVERTRELIAAERARLVAGLGALGCAVVPGEANYLLVRSPLDGFAERVAAHGVIVRDCGNFEGLPKGYVRVAVRTPEENDWLLQACTGALKAGDTEEGSRSWRDR